MMTDSTMRLATKLSATVSLCRLTIGHSTTAVPMLVIARKISQSAPSWMRVSAPLPRM